MSHSVGDNINGRSVIPVLTGLGNPFVQYFMYFAHPVEKPQAGLGTWDDGCAAICAAQHKNKER
jgi:hypothetical protein